MFVIDIDWDANKNIINLAKHPHKLQNTHSLYNQYLLGNFGGIPFVEYFDADYFKNIAGEVTDEKNNKKSTNCLIICHGKSEYLLANYLKSNLRIPAKIVSDKMVRKVYKLIH